MSWGRLLAIRTLLQNSMTILGDASTVGATNVAGSVGESRRIADGGRCWSLSAQFEPLIVTKRDKSSKWSGDLPPVLEPRRPLSQSSGRRERQ